jgi:hypothetical protein
MLRHHSETKLSHTLTIVVGYHVLTCMVVGSTNLD